MKLKYTRRGFADRGEIFEFLAERSPMGAKSVMARLDAAIDQLLAQPLSGQATDVPGVRVLFVRRYPYKVFYHLRDDVLEIVHLRHTARRLPDDI